MEDKIEITESDHTRATGTAEAYPAAHNMLLNHAHDICDGNGNDNGGSHDRIGKGSNNNNVNNVIDILDLAAPQSKVRPIDRLLDRYDWSSASMTPLLQDADRLQRTPPPYDRPLSHRRRRQAPSPPRRPASSPPRRPPAPIQPLPPTPPPPPTRPPMLYNALDFSDRTPPVRKSLWKSARESMSSCFVRAAAAGSKAVCFWSR